MPNAAARSCIWSTARRASIATAYKTIRGELEAYGHGLGEKPEIVALNKIDAIPKAQLAKKKARAGKSQRRQGVSAFRRHRRRRQDVLRALAKEIAKRRAGPAKSKSRERAWSP